MEEKPQFLFSKDNYRYFDLEISEENFFSRRISKNIDIKKKMRQSIFEKIDFD